MRDYLWEEVLAALDPHQRHLLAVLAATDGGDAPLLEAATGERVDLQDLPSEVPLATLSEDGWASLHALWSEPLASSLDADAEAPLLASGDWEAIRRWVRAELLESLGRPRAALDELGPVSAGAGLIQDQLDAARVQALWSAGEVEAALSTGEPALARSSRSGSSRTAQRAHALAARYTAYLGRGEDAATHLQAVDRHPPADRLIDRRRRIARAAVQVLAGDEDRAADELSFLGDGSDLDPFLTAQ